jgi:hypothetical protein
VTLLFFLAKNWRVVITRITVVARNMISGSIGIISSSIGGSGRTPRENTESDKKLAGKFIFIL